MTTGTRSRVEGDADRHDDGDGLPSKGRQPTERTLIWLRKLGYTCDVVERRVARSLVTKDLFGCLDLVAIRDGDKGVLGVQTTTAPHLAERVAKVKAEPRAALWVACGNRIIVVGWKQETSGRKLWTPKLVELHAGGITEAFDVLLPRDSAALA